MPRMIERRAFKSNPHIEKVADGIYGIRREDDRLLTFVTSGQSNGSPVFYAHGMPGSHVGLPRGIRMTHAGAWVIGVVRPGYGESTRQPGRSVVDFADEVAALADVLELDRFAVVGRSGGGPHALACGARMPDRVSRLAVLACPAPIAMKGWGWIKELAESNQEIYRQQDPRIIENKILDRAFEVRRDPSKLLNDLAPELVPSDVQVLGDIAIKHLLTESYAQALSHGLYGWVDDALALKKPWGFELSDVRADKVTFWAAGDDNFSPVNDTKVMAESIEGATVAIERDAGHFSAAEALPRYLAWAARND